MTTKKNLVKQVLMSILTAGIFGFGFTACSDDLNELGSAQSVPEIAGSSRSLENMEQWSYTVPVEIYCEGPWKIEFKFDDEDNHFCYALPNQGEGPAIVKICVLDNWSNKRNSGEMVITDLKDTSKSTTLKLSQKCNLDNPNIMHSMTRGSDDGDGNEAAVNSNLVGDIIYGAGYGYNATKPIGEGAVCRNQILAIEKLNADGVAQQNGKGRKLTGTRVNISNATYYGRTINEVTKNVEAKCNLKGNYKGFSGEVGSSFTSTQKSNMTSAYVLSIHNAKVCEAIISGLDANTYCDYLTDNARIAINGTGKAYASNDEGFAQLIKDYGTHLILQADLGGRLRYASTVDKSLTTNESETKAYAKCGYKNNVVEGEGSVNNSIKKKYESNKGLVVTNITAIGGSLSAIANMKSEDNDDNVRNWIASLENQEKLEVIDNLNDDNLIPLWKLVDTSTPEGMQRQAALKHYLETGLASDQGEFANTDITCIDLGAFVNFTIPNDPWMHPLNVVTKTWVKEIVSQGKVIAMLCHEYIPNLDNNACVDVIYPVSKGLPNFSKGIFLGNSRYPMRSVAWSDDGSVTLKNISKEKGHTDKLYYREGQFITKEQYESYPESVTIINADIKDKYLEGKKQVPSLSAKVNDLKIVKKNIPLVKLGTKIWTRENYFQEKGNTDNATCMMRSNYEFTYFTCAFVGDGRVTAPAGWRVASSNDYNIIKTVLTSEGNLTPAKGLFQQRFSTSKAAIAGPGDVINGFNATLDGWWNWDVDPELNPITLAKKIAKGEAPVKFVWKGHEDSDTEMYFYTSDKHLVTMKTDGTFEIKDTPNKFLKALPVRLVMD